MFGRIVDIAADGADVLSCRGLEDDFAHGNDGGRIVEIDDALLRVALQRFGRVRAEVMNTETYEQININKDLITGGDFLKEGETMVMASIDDQTGAILTAEAPVKIVLKVTYTEPGLKGDTATNATKPATLETGVEIRVPLFINEGDLIEVDTRDGSYVSRKS